MQPRTPAFLAPYMADPNADFATALTTDPGSQAPAEKIRAALDAASRSA